MADVSLDPDLLELRLHEFEALEWIGYINSLPPVEPSPAAGSGEPAEPSEPVVRGTRGEFLAPALALLRWDRSAPDGE